MISEVLSEAVVDLDRYLNEPTYDDCYAGKLREKIVKLRDEMMLMVRVLETPPGLRLPSRATLLKEIGRQRDIDALKAEEVARIVEDRISPPQSF